MNGKGTIFYKNGKVKYQGIFVNDKIEKGEYYIEDGKVYSGTFKNWMKHGKGIIYNEHNILYEGTFVNNKYDGDGEELLDDGTTYHIVLILTDCLLLNLYFSIQQRFISVLMKKKNCK